MLAAPRWWRCPLARPGVCRLKPRRRGFSDGATRGHDRAHDVREGRTTRPTWCRLPRREARSLRSRGRSPSQAWRRRGPDCNAGAHRSQRRARLERPTGDREIVRENSRARRSTARPQAAVVPAGRRCAAVRSGYLPPSRAPYAYRALAASAFAGTIWWAQTSALTSGLRAATDSRAGSAGPRSSIVVDQRESEYS